MYLWEGREKVRQVISGQWWRHTWRRAQAPALPVACARQNRILLGQAIFNPGRGGMREGTGRQAAAAHISALSASPVSIVGVAALEKEEKEKELKRLKSDSCRPLLAFLVHTT